MSRTIGVFVSPDYFDVTNNDEPIPEKTLLAAVLWRAYWDLQPNVEPPDRLSAVRWFEGHTNMQDYTGFAYGDIADILNLSAKHQELIREAVYRAKFEEPVELAKRKKGDPRYNTVVNRVRYRASA